MRNTTLMTAAVVLAAVLMSACDEPAGPASYQAPIEQRPEILDQRDASRTTGADHQHHEAGSADTLAWTLPAGWVEEPGGGPMRHTTIRSSAQETDDTLTVAVSRFAGDIGGLLPNVNRWRVQVGLEPIGEDKLGENIRRVENSAVPCLIADMTGPDQRMVVAWFSDGTVHWFFRATATPQVIEQHSLAFAELIASVKAAPNAEAPEAD